MSPAIEDGKVGVLTGTKGATNSKTGVAIGIYTFVGPKSTKKICRSVLALYHSDSHRMVEQTVCSRYSEEDLRCVKRVGDHP